MLNLTHALASIEKSSGLSNACYVHAAMFQHEKNTLFRDKWTALGFGKDISEQGIVKPIIFLGIPMIMARNWALEINVFQNVCRHRGIILVEKSQRLRGSITCPYHAWIHDLNGNLRKTPNIGGPNINTVDSVQHCESLLIGMRSHVWNEMFFVSISEAAPAFELYAAQLMTW